MTQDFLNKQLYRLYHLGGFPQTAEGVQDLGQAFEKHCKSEEHVKRLISAWLESPRCDMNGKPQAPGISEVIAMAVETVPASQGKRPICPVCNGDGFIPDTPAFSQGMRYERVKRCQCDTQASSSDRNDFSVFDLTQTEWFIRDLAEMPQMIAKWKRLAGATRNSSGFPVTEKQRQFAAKVVRAVEDHLGQAV